MTEAPTGAARVKRRQMLLLAGIAALVAGAALLSVLLTASPERDTSAPKPKTTHILAPGAQVDPKDAWRGQADAQLKAIERNAREVSQRSEEVSRQNKEMMERLKKLEHSGLPALPPPPVSVPAAKPDFGPDLPLPEGVTGAQAAQRLPPPPPPPIRVGGSTIPAPGAAPAGMPSAPSGIVSIVLAEPPAPKGAAPEGTKTAQPRDTRRYIRLPRLFEDLRIAHGDGTFGKRLSALAKTNLLLIDDWGLAPPTAAQRSDLLEVLDDRVGTRSTLITSQLPVKHWHEHLGER